MFVPLRAEAAAVSRALAPLPPMRDSARGQTHQRARQELDLAAGAHLECRHGYDPQVMWNFECPSCGAKYLKTKIEDQAENRESANCEHCLASFEPREGAYLFQYELIEHPSAGR